MEDDIIKPVYRADARLCIPHGIFSRRSHQLQARFDTIIDWDQINESGVLRMLPDIIQKRWMEDDELDIPSILGRPVYVRDVCVRCGMTIERL